MNATLLRLTLALLPAAVLLSQSGRAQTLPDDSRDNVVLKWAPLSMLDYHNTFQVGVEIPLPVPGLSFQQELGYGHARFSIWHSENARVPDRHNFRSRSQLRYYVKGWNTFRLFAAAEHFLRRSVTQNMDYIGVECDGPCAYYRETEYTTERIVNAFHGKFGFQTWLTPRLCLDVYSGLGIRGIKSRSLTPGVTSVRWQDDGGWWEEANVPLKRPVASLSTGFQLGIRLGKISP